MAAVAAQTAAYFYPESEDPLGAFDFWLSPCGGSDLVPEDLKKAFDILSNVADGVSSFEPPKKLGKGKGKKGDAGNPRGRGNGNNGSGKGNGNNNGNNNSGNKKNPCRIRPGQSTYRLNPADVGNTLRVQSCRGDSTVRTEYIITSLVYAPNAARLPIKSKCKKEWEQACYHYSSAVRVNSQWATITCNVEAATTQHRLEGLATDVWARQHEGTGWRDKQYRQHQGQCDRDEYPPAHLLGRSDLAWQRSGLDAEEGQLVRLIPSKMNQEAGKAWWGACFDPAVAKITDNNVFRRMVEGAPQNLRRTAHDRTAKPGKHVTDITRTFAAVTVAYRPEWSFEWEHTAPLDDGLWDNGCWPQLAVPDDPRFALLDFDAAYNYGQEPTRWRYDQPYVPGQNGFQP